MKKEEEKVKNVETNSVKNDSGKNNKIITTRAEDYSQWYQDIIAFGDLAEHSVVRGCMVIKPYGYAIWEKYCICY